MRNNQTSIRYKLSDLLGLVRYDKVVYYRDFQYDNHGFFKYYFKTSVPAREESVNLPANILNGLRQLSKTNDILLSDCELVYTMTNLSKNAITISENISIQRLLEVMYTDLYNNDIRTITFPNGDKYLSCYSGIFSYDTMTPIIYITNTVKTSPFEICPDCYVYIDSHVAKHTSFGDSIFKYLVPNICVRRSNVQVVIKDLKEDPELTTLNRVCVSQNDCLKNIVKDSIPNIMRSIK